MDFLKLCQRARSEMGIPGNGPASVIGQTGELGRLVNWVAQSWVDIQEARIDWEFMRKSFSVDTVAGQQEYDASTDVLLTDFGRWKEDSFRIYLKSAGVANEIFLSQVDYGSFRDFYLFGTRRSTQARPTTIAVTPAKKLALGFAPDAVYVLDGEYYCKPSTLAANADTPTMPEQFHMLIIYKAMQKYGLFEAAQEQTAIGQQGYSEMMARMQFDQAPALCMAAPLI